MALLFCCNHLPSLSPPPSSSSPSSTFAITASPVSKLHFKGNGLNLKSVRIYNALNTSKRCDVIVKASEIDGTAPTAGAEAPKEEVVPVDKLPLESKEQERLEQKTRMKLAKKIRLRRARLMRKRKMRKKGRWPPSKMKKLKNV